jgi:hypothetical protein
MGVVMLIKKSFSRAGFFCAGLGLLKERGSVVEGKGQSMLI